MDGGAHGLPVSCPRSAPRRIIKFEENCTKTYSKYYVRTVQLLVSRRCNSEFGRVRQHSPRWSTLLRICSLPTCHYRQLHRRPLGLCNGSMAITTEIVGNTRILGARAISRSAYFSYSEQSMCGSISTRQNLFPR